jgi:hypothetical protein
MNEYGKLGGSNIISAETQNSEIIKNGGFEELDPETGYPDYWRYYNSLIGYYFVESAVKYEGSYSIRIENAPGVNYYLQLVDPKMLVPYSHYILRYWIRHDALAGGDEFAVFINTIEFNWHVQVNTIQGPKVASDWTMFEYEFTAPDVNTSMFSFGFYFYITGGNAWLDNISLKKVI